MYFALFIIFSFPLMHFSVEIDTEIDYRYPTHIDIFYVMKYLLVGFDTTAI